MKRAVLYARVSSDDRPQDGRNLRGQIEMCRQYAQENEWKIVAELIEDEKGASGYEQHLPELEKLLTMAENGEFDILVAREMDRLSRSLAKQLRIEGFLGRLGVKIEYVLGDYPDTVDGQLLKNLHAIISEYEREKILERLKRGRRLSVKAGNVMGKGKSPYGYKIVTIAGVRRLVIVRDQAKIIRRIFEWYLNGIELGKPLSLSAMARRLNALGIPTRSQALNYLEQKRPVSKFWRPQDVGQILRNETYAGVWRWGKGQITEEGHWIKRDPATLQSIGVPAIIDRKRWDAVQEIFAKGRSKNIEIGSGFLLYRRLTCPDCGSFFSTRKRIYASGAKYRYYLCSKAFGRKSPCVNNKCYPAEWLDDVVFSWIKNLVETHSKAVNATNEGHREDKKSHCENLIDIEKAVSSKQKNLDCAIYLYLCGELSIAEIKQKQKENEEALGLIEAINAEYHSENMSTSPGVWNIFTSFFQPETIEEVLTKCRTDIGYRKRIIDVSDTTGILYCKNDQLIAQMTSLLGNNNFSKKTRRIISRKFIS